MKNVMTTTSEENHKVLTQLANDKGESLRDLLREILTKEVDQHQLIKRAIEFGEHHTGDPVSNYWLSLLGNPSLAMGMSPQEMLKQLASQDTNTNYTLLDLRLMVWALCHVQEENLYKQLDVDLYKYQSIYSFEENDSDNDDVVSIDPDLLTDNHLAEIVDVPWGRNVFLVNDLGMKVDWHKFSSNVAIDCHNGDFGQIVNDLKLIRKYYGIQKIAESEAISALGITLVTKVDVPKPSFDDVKLNDGVDTIVLDSPANKQVLAAMRDVMRDND